MRKSELADQIACELGQLREVGRVAAQLAAVPPEERRPWDSAAAAKYIADFVLGIENLCKRRHLFLGTRPPEGPDSHTQTLNEFLDAEGPGGGLAPEVQHRLKLYLRFRHRFFHGYGHEVKWEVVEEPLRLLPDTIAAVADAWERWLGSLR